MLVFETLTLDDANRIQTFVNRFEPYSDFNFLSLYSWSLHSQTRFALADDCLYLLLTDYITQENIATFLCDQNHWQNFQRLSRWLDQSHLPQKFDLLPDKVVEYLRPELEKSELKYELTENRAAHDYILDVSKVSTASGKDYDNFRSKRNHFKSVWGPMTREINFNPTETSDQIKALQLANKWAERKKSKNEVYEDEIDAFSRFLGAASQTNNLRFSAIEHNGQLIALASCEILPKSFAIGHFLKYDWEYKGVYYSLVQNMCSKLVSEKVTWLNIEQDLDIPGLREAKLKLRPVGFLKKYSLQIQPGN